jgi:hypothetical protein
VLTDLWGRQRGGRKGHWEKKLPRARGGGNHSFRNHLEETALVEQNTPSADALAEAEAELLVVAGDEQQAAAVEADAATQQQQQLSSPNSSSVLFGSATPGRKVRWSESHVTPRRIGSFNSGSGKKLQLLQSPVAPLQLQQQSPEGAAPLFQDTLPCLTPNRPRLGSGSAAPPVSRDSIIHAIFEALFGRRRVRRGPRETFGGDWDALDEVGYMSPLSTSVIRRDITCKLTNIQAQCINV